MTKYHAKLEKLADMEGYDDVDQLFECRALDSTVSGICVEQDVTSQLTTNQTKTRDSASRSAIYALCRASRSSFQLHPSSSPNRRRDLNGCTKSNGMAGVFKSSVMPRASASIPAIRPIGPSGCLVSSRPRASSRPTPLSLMPS